MSALLEKIAKLFVSGMHGRLLQAYFGRHYSSPTFQSSSPVPCCSQIIQSHVPVPCSSGESSPAIRDTPVIALLYLQLMQGKLKYEEHVTEGFDNMFDAFVGLFTGSGTNFGKPVVKA